MPKKGVVNLGMRYVLRDMRPNGLFRPAADCYVRPIIIISLEMSIVALLFSLLNGQRREGTRGLPRIISPINQFLFFHPIRLYLGRNCRLLTLKAALPAK